MAAAGGGAKGIAQVQVLKALEKEAQCPLYTQYDLLIGSSVGAIDMAVLAAGKISMEEYAKNYRRYLTTIFKKRRLPFFGPKYSKKNFISLWNEIIGDDIPFGAVKTKLMISSVDLIENKNYYFKSWKREHAKLSLCDIVVKSFSAPYYFGYTIDKKEKKIWADGGTGSANYPIGELKNQIEALKWYHTAECKKGVNTCHIDIVGALFPENTNTFKKMKRYRTLRQTLHFFNIPEGGLARAQSRNNQLGKLLHIVEKNPTLSLKYWDKSIPAKMEGIDKLRYVDTYIRAGQEMAKKPLIALHRKET
ncbi:hypothetical protein CALK_1143 [Chitinivibrio alkaliphilus ACht1]|uniref:PNPLA domain-containing protein n=2 Tax=Chitinivibrio TaxID=1505231 RepID=U7DBY9_9BACT|nr:hypothetical protein CALK_1143 [Chitinivibrio alkaliphilus ACht1]